MRGQTWIAICLLLAVPLVGCIGDAPSEQADPAGEESEDAVDETPPELPEVITGFEEVASVEANGGNGLWIHEDKAYVSAGNGGFFILDVSDPTEPEKLGNLTGLYARDADVLTYENRTVVALAAGGGGMHFVDVTEPRYPELLTTLDIGASVHNLAVVEGTHWVYNSRSLGDAVEPGMEIVNVSDPEQPEVEKVWTFPRQVDGHPVATTGCHDVTIYPVEERAYCAGVTETFIMDIGDPLNPEVISVIANPAINIHHWAVPNQDHSILIIGDEYGGAAAPACFASATTDEATVSTPTGAVWFYDIQDPQQPVPLSWVSPPTETENPTSCTAHFGDLVGDRSMIAVGWYSQGVLLVDFQDPLTPRIVDQAATDHNVWDARYTDGHLITGNSDGGSTVLGFAGQDGGDQAATPWTQTRGQTTVGSLR